PLRRLHSFPTRRSSDLAILVRRIRCARNKVLAIDHARTVGLIRRNPPVEIANGGNAAVNDRHSDARAIQTPLLPSDLSIDAFWRSEEHTSELQSRFDLV